ncbi:hypothetical protein [Kineococcus gypseus]|uniref:hypothetical protein n=1 Tax=Kineococcus gypseus TaxID=1637102 RepID=UPI003D7DE177
MPASSLIFLVIVLLWAAYLVPAAIRRRRHATDARVADRDSAALRVVVRQGSAPALASAAAPASSRPVLAAGPARAQLSAARPGTPAAPAAPAAPVRPAGAQPRVLVRQARTSRVVRRRRQLLLGVLGATVLAWALVAAALAPVAAALLPTAALGLVVAALRRHAAQAPARAVVPTAVVAPAARAATTAEPVAPVVPVVPVAPEAASVLDDPTARPEREPAGEPAAAVPAPRPQPQAPAADGTWEPAEVPLPTYLLKPRARVVRPAAHPVAAAAGARPVLEVDVELAGAAAPAPSVRARRVVDVREHERARAVNG